jgi:CRISPR-associated protein Csm4
VPQLTPYLLRFRSGLHIGTRGVTLEEAGVSIPSDTIFSALLQSWLMTGADIEKFVAPFKRAEDAPFLITSAFPFAGSVRFYPMPLNITGLFTPSTIEVRGKGLKHIRFLSEELLKIVLKGENMDMWLFPENQPNSRLQGVALQGGSLWLSETEISKLPPNFRIAKDPKPVLPSLSLWKTSRVPRVTIERITSYTNIYQAGRVQFAEGCGLWFGVDWRDPSAKPSQDMDYKLAFQKALSVLQDDGIGGERSSGYGAFTFEEKKEPVLFDDPKEVAYLLSRYIPPETELPEVLTNERSAYALISVNGWLQTLAGASQRRKSQLMVTEGSLVCPAHFPTGSINDLKPKYDDPSGELPHSVYRNGLAVALNWTR